MSQAPTISPLVDWRTCERQVIRGLDHLGVSAFSIAVYNVLLPGVTNVTDRARYFSFYPWIIHSYARETRTDDRRRWLTWYRRLDYAYALASAAAEQKDNGSARGVVGADRARAQLRNAPDSDICELKPADLNQEGKVPAGAYFKNPQGGYGQYYKAVLRSLGVFVENDDETCMYPDMQLTKYAGQPIATTLDAQPAFKQLKEIAAAGRATVKDLADLGAKVGPSAIELGSAEHQLLCKLFWAEDDAVCKAQSQDSRHWRRCTFQAILSFLDAFPNADDAVSAYRWGCASQSLTGRSSWRPPESLAPMVRAWADYQWNEMFNYALETLLWATVELLRERPRSPGNLSRDIVDSALAAPKRYRISGERVADFVNNTIDVSVESSSKLQDGAAPAAALMEDIADAIADNKVEVASAGAFRLLGHLASVPGETPGALFATLPGAAELLGSHPIHLPAWRRRVAGAADQRLDRFLQQLVVDWIVHRHLRVATRKLASQGVHTFKFAPEEDQLICLTEEDLTPGPTNPRLRQGIQILTDLGYVAATEDGLALSSAGLERLGALR